MSTAPSNGKTTHAVTAGNRMPAGASVDRGPEAKAGKKAKAQMTPEQRKQLMVVGIAAGVVLIVGVSIYAYFSYVRAASAPPRLNEPNPMKFAQYINSNDFDQLPFDRQRLYMKEMVSRKKALEDEYKAGKISKAQFEDVLAIAWLGKQFKHMEKYYSLGELDKKYELDHIIDSKKADEPKKEGDPKKNANKIKAVVEKFPQDERRVYEAFQRAIKTREKERDKEDKLIGKAGKVTTRPATRPANPTPAKPLTTGVKPKP